MTADPDLPPALPPELSEELASIDGLVSRARNDLADGAILDLEPLERRVAHLCAGIQALPTERGRCFAPRLTALLSDLEALGGQIKVGCEALSAELGTSGKRRDAMSAYSRKG